jgi:hypothetical protein
VVYFVDGALFRTTDRSSANERAMTVPLLAPGALSTCRPSDGFNSNLESRAARVWSQIAVGQDLDVSVLLQRSLQSTSWGFRDLTS